MVSGSYHLPYELSQKSVLINGQGLVVVNLQVFEAHCVPHTMHITFLCHSSFCVFVFLLLHKLVNIQIIQSSYICIFICYYVKYG